MIGLEVHCQLNTLQSKLFCACKADYHGLKPNENICLICAGIPGSLPRLNSKAVRLASMIALSLNCKMPEKIAFFRKNYFYPDLPKNFQITQLNTYGETCIGGVGYLMMGDKKVRITRVQLEEDPGKLIHADNKTMVDYNRAGTPLVEIVTGPDFETPRQTREFMVILANMFSNMQISNTSLEGAVRVDVNISINDGDKVEVKNIGSFHDLEKAAMFEITRQETLLKRGIQIVQETRHWDAKKKITTHSRSKEAESDYRYLLESDIPWVRMESKMLDELKSKMPENVNDRRERYISKYGVSPQVADVLSSSKYCCDLFEKACNDSNAKEIAKEIANMIANDLIGIDEYETKITSFHLRGLADLTVSGKISGASAKNALREIIKTGKTVDQVVKDLDLTVMSDNQKLDSIISSVIREEADAVKQCASNPKIIHYLVGKVMKKTKGKANPDETLEILMKKLHNP